MAGDRLVLRARTAEWLVGVQAPLTGALHREEPVPQNLSNDSHS